MRLRCVAARTLISRVHQRGRSPAYATLAEMKVPKQELLSDILKQLSGDSALPVFSNIEKYRREKGGVYVAAEDFNEAAKKRKLGNEKERMRVSVHWNSLVSYSEGRQPNRAPVCVEIRTPSQQFAGIHNRFLFYSFKALGRLQRPNTGSFNVKKIPLCLHVKSLFLHSHESNMNGPYVCRIYQD